MVALLLIITLTTTTPVLIQKKYSAISLVAPTLSNPSPVRLPVARVSVPPVAVSSQALPVVVTPMSIPAPRTPRVERTVDVPAPPAPKPVLQPNLLAQIPAMPVAKPVHTGFFGDPNGVPVQQPTSATSRSSGTGIGRELWNPGYRYGPPVGKGRGYRSIWHAERRFWPDEQSREER